MRTPGTTGTTETRAAFEIVIAGGGFAGVRLARLLMRNGPRRAADGRPVRVTLVDRHDYLTYTPLLYDVAGGSVDPRNAATPLRDLLWDEGITLRQAEITGVDRERRVLRTGAGDVPYSRLVFALGAASTLPLVDRDGTAGLLSRAVPFMTLDDANAIRLRVTRQCTAVATAAAPTPGDLTFTVIGGGPKGVELIFDLADLLIRQLVPEYALPPERLRLLLVHDRDRLMSELSPGFDTAARAAMARRGVRLLEGVRVVGANDRRLLTADGRAIETQTVVWAAGIAPHPLVRELGVPLVDGGIAVDDHLRLPGDAAVYVAGDCARTDDGEGGRVPASASLAQQHGKFLARALAAELRDEPLPVFRRVDRGNIVTFGGDDGYAEIGSGPAALRFRGPAAAAARAALDLSEVPGLDQKRGTLRDLIASRQ